MDMVWVAVEKARHLTPLEASHLPLNQSALVVGGGIAGMTAAAALARQGFETHLVEKERLLGGMLNQLDHIAPAEIGARELVTTKSRELIESDVHLHLDTTVETIGGVVGSFQTLLADGTNLKTGVVVVATGSDPYQPTEFDYGADPRVITNLELEYILNSGEPEADRITFIACVGSRQGCMGCSRYCCTSMISQAMKLRKMGKKVRV